MNDPAIVFIFVFGFIITSALCHNVVSLISDSKSQSSESEESQLGLHENSVHLMK